MLDARGILDTQTFSYHLIPMLMAVAAWEVFARGRLPVVATLATVALQISTRVLFTDNDISSWTFNTIFLSWTTALAVYLLFAAMRRERARAGSPVSPLRSATPC